MNYYYKCSSCKKEFSLNELGKKLIYLCPKCGKAERNKPLEGVLEIIYDYQKIINGIGKERLRAMFAGQIWDYPFLFPLAYSYDEKRSKYSFDKIEERLLNKIRLPLNNIVEVNESGNNLFVFDDSLNPTLSYKDRASILVCLFAIQNGIKNIAAASTGNAGSSLAGIASKLALSSHIFAPSKIPASKRIQIQSFGSKLYLVDGTYDDAFDLCMEVCGRLNWYNRNTAYNPLTIEGKKSAAFEIYSFFEDNIPEYIFVPVGDGVIIKGLYKGFWELKELNLISNIPKLIAVQAEGSNAVCRFMGDNQFSFQPTSTIADSIDAAAPRNLYLAADAVHKSGGYCIEVSDSEIMNAQQKLAREHGLLS
ncbi:MAG: pyridoxal-phosphate dependent enzyme, partial [Bacteroidetes bacterium]|nr:pyridoxal-phosphate dependent enzyme [Bacteroidota bacterium]